MIELSATDWLGLFGHFLLLSLLAIGGAMSTAPDMHRYIVSQQHWLSDAGFSTSVALAQAAPGPNLLFVAVVGWNIAGAAGVCATLGGMLLPSTVLTLAVARWGQARAETAGVRAFKAGMAPVTLGLVVSTGWLLAEPFVLASAHRIPAAVLIAATVLAMLRTRIAPIWLIAIGAAVGAVGGI